PARASGRVDRLHGRRQGGRHDERAAAGADLADPAAVAVRRHERRGVHSARVSAPVRLALALVASLLLLPAVASAKEPPNQNDPCSTGGRNTCGTLGVGFYDTYKYGLRWFGDYRGAVPDLAHTFCIDLQYWYPAAKYRFKEATADTLKNREGATVSLESRRRM